MVTNDIVPISAISISFTSNRRLSRLVQYLERKLEKLASFDREVRILSDVKSGPRLEVGAVGQLKLHKLRPKSHEGKVKVLH